MCCWNCTRARTETKKSVHGAVVPHLPPDDHPGVDHLGEHPLSLFCCPLLLLLLFHSPLMRSLPCQGMNVFVYYGSTLLTPEYFEAVTSNTYLLTFVTAGLCISFFLFYFSFSLVPQLVWFLFCFFLPCFCHSQVCCLSCFLFLIFIFIFSLSPDLVFLLAFPMADLVPCFSLSSPPSFLLSQP